MHEGGRGLEGVRVGRRILGWSWIWGCALSRIIAATFARSGVSA